MIRHKICYLQVNIYIYEKLCLMKLTTKKSECRNVGTPLLVTTRKAECKKEGTPLMVTTKKALQKRFIADSQVEYCITVEAFPMAYAYSEKISQGDKFICEYFSIN